MLDSDPIVFSDKESVCRIGKEASVRRSLFDTCKRLPQWSCFAFPALPHCNVKKGRLSSLRKEAEASMMYLIWRSSRRCIIDCVLHVCIECATVWFMNLILSFLHQSYSVRSWRWYSEYEPHQNHLVESCSWWTGYVAVLKVWYLVAMKAWDLIFTLDSW